MLTYSSSLVLMNWIYIFYASWTSLTLSCALGCMQYLKFKAASHRTACTRDESLNISRKFQSRESLTRSQSSLSLRRCYILRASECEARTVSMRFFYYSDHQIIMSEQCQRQATTTKHLANDEKECKEDGCRGVRVRTLTSSSLLRFLSNWFNENFVNCIWIKWIFDEKCKYLVYARTVLLFLLCRRERCWKSHHCVDNGSMLKLWWWWRVSDVLG